MNKGQFLGCSQRLQAQSSMCSNLYNRFPLLSQSCRLKTLSAFGTFEVVFVPGLSSSHDLLCSIYGIPTPGRILSISLLLSEFRNVWMRWEIEHCFLTPKLLAIAHVVGKGAPRNHSVWAHFSLTGFKEFGFTRLFLQTAHRKQQQWKLLPPQCTFCSWYPVLNTSPILFAPPQTECIWSLS